MPYCRPLCLLILSVFSFPVIAQENDSLLTGSHPVMSPHDSLSIFSLIDSLLQLAPPGSQLVVRLGYNSNVLSAGRTLGIENFGLAPGISYYHSSGAYADVSGFWSRDFDPAYYLTTVSVGYMHDFSEKFSFMAGYDRYFYQAAKDQYIPYANTLSVTPVLEFKPVTLIMNYAFYFGDSYAHRIQPGITFTLGKRQWLGLDRIAFTPGFYALFGTEIFTEIRYPDTLREIIRRIRMNLPWYEQTDRKVFGLMNYLFTAPLSITFRKWSFNVTYNYSIPKALPGETLTFAESSYLSGSLSYFISLKRDKLSL
ncbi:MAG TPA: hypothetical protein VD816_18740 [Ohtaekwangia sp.]|nr:hypothetical protein [Ohtaekwangia sp.]